MLEDDLIESLVNKTLNNIKMEIDKLNRLKPDKLEIINNINVYLSNYKFDYKGIKNIQ